MSHRSFPYTWLELRHAYHGAAALTNAGRDVSVFRAIQGSATPRFQFAFTGRFA